VTSTSTTIEIAAAPAAIFALASATPRWPLILPHYRYVRVRETDGARRIVAMSVWRDIFPLAWVAEQTDDSSRPHIAFRHVGGLTRGMEVEWTFTPAGERTRVSIVHRLDFALPLLRLPPVKALVAGYFIDGVARRTLARIKAIAERGEG
jgi:ribosome-associated toxin RatA of RatAB toxin-antitoxin module